MQPQLEQAWNSFLWGIGSVEIIISGIVLIRGSLCVRGVFLIPCWDPKQINHEQSTNTETLMVCAESILPFIANETLVTFETSRTFARHEALYQRRG